ncbi:conserved Plasmodium protein, unknown function [Plasmodium ovale]|uniref:Uncharacterized protein n=2 Tax=Plasmodium ovale TaxID=36330 RepID=A0A1C3KTE4_PLAOA|nr:conserved Plasmodium protein, unknown function [Plasmodium ovale]
MEGEEMNSEFATDDISLFEMSCETNLRVNIINNDKNYVEHYTNVLKNRQVQNVKYFDFDITDDVNEINAPFSIPLKMSDKYETDYIQFKVKKMLFPSDDNAYIKKVLLHDMNIEVHHEEKD